MTFITLRPALQITIAESGLYSIRVRVAQIRHNAGMTRYFRRQTTKQFFTKIRGQIKCRVDALVSFVYVLVHPGYWLQNKQYSAIWDAQLNKLLAKNKFKDYDGYNASLGGLKIWVSNHPYASFTFKHVRPKRTTILKAHRQLMRDIIIEATQEDEVSMLNRMYEPPK